MSNHPAFARLDALGCRALDRAGLEGFAGGPGPRVVLVAGEAGKRPEAVDAAVALCELLREFPLPAARAAAEAEGFAQSRFGAAVLPALLFLRGGEVEGKLLGLKDWSVYRDAFAARSAEVA